MPPRGFKCTVEVNIEAVSSPGTWLPNRDDLYLTIELFGQAKRTRLVEPAFPLRLQERFIFEKVFWPASDPQDVLEMLDELPVTMELRQVTDVYLGGCLLAYYDMGAREFLYPIAGASVALTNGCAAYRGSRQAQMVRTVDFIGPGPCIEFATRAAIVESGGVGGGAELLDDSDDLDAPPLLPPTHRRSRSSRCRRRPGYGRQTLAAVLRSRSPSPYAVAAASTALRNSDYEPQVPTRQRRSRRRQPPTPDIVPTAPVRVDGRPPFVVRRVDKGLVGRTPVLHDTFTRLGGPHGPLPLPASHSKAQLSRSNSSVELRSRRPVSSRAGRLYGDEFDEDLATYRPLSPYVSGRSPPSEPRWPPRHRGESPLRQRLYSSHHRLDEDDFGSGGGGGANYDDDNNDDVGYDDLRHRLKRVRIRESRLY